MITTVPAIGKGELVYSFMARYRSMTGITDRQAMALLLGGVDCGHIAADLTLNLEELSSRLGSPDVSGTYLLENHTLFRYWAHFLDERGNASARRLMLEGWDGTGRRTVIRGKQSGEVRYLRFCTVCAEEDVAVLGAPAWRRQHQMPAVSVCDAHRTDLWDTDVPCGLNYHLRPCPDDPVHSSPAPHVLGRDTAVRLAAASACLLGKPPDRGCRFSMADRVRTALGNAGWMDRGDRPGRNVDGRGLRAAVVGRFGVDGLERLGAGMGSGKWVDFLHAPVPQCRVTPLMYLLLADFLGISPGSLLSTVPDPRWAARGDPRSGKERQPLPLARIRIFKERIRSAMKASPGASRSELRRAAPYAYTALSSNDPAWLDATLPKKPGGSMHRSWEARDLELAARLPVIVEAILSRDPPRRVTRLGCAKDLGYRLPVRRLERLPRTRAALALAVESAGAFRLRNPPASGTRRQPLRQVSTE